MAAGDSETSAAAAVASSHGLFAVPFSCEEDLQRVTQLWDTSGSGVRTSLLAGFLCRFGTRPAADLEKGLVGGASLLLSRLVAALRLSGSHFSGGGVPAFTVPLSPLLAAIRVFLGAQQCQRFAAEALEAGGLDALLAILRRTRLRASHADAALKTLGLLLVAGRRFKEAFGAADGLRVLCELLGRPQAAPPAVAERVERLLLHLHEGSRRHVDHLVELMCQLAESTETQAQLVSCRVLASVLPRASTDSQRSTVTPLLVLLRHPDVQLHIEVAGTLRVLAATQCRNDVVRGLVSLLFPTDAISTDDPLYVTEPALSELYAVPASHVFCQQAAAVRVVDLLSAWCPRVLDSLLAADLVGGLLVALASTPNPESQSVAARLLRRLAPQRPAVRSRLEAALTAAQMALLMHDAPQLAEKLTVREAARIRAGAGFSYLWEGEGGAMASAETPPPVENSSSILTVSSIGDGTLSSLLDDDTGEEGEGEEEEDVKTD